MNITLLTRPQKKMLWLFILAAAALITLTVMRYNAFVKQEKNSQILNELKVCRSWNNNLNSLKARCEADAEKAAYGSGVSQIFPVYADKANTCRAEFAQLKKSFLERAASNSEADFYYKTAELAAAWNSSAAAILSDKKAGSGIKSEAERLAEFIKLSGKEGREMLLELNSCRIGNTELMLSAQMYEGQAAVETSI